MSESISGISDSDYENIYVPKIGPDEQLESPRLNPNRKIHRMNFRRELELVEINFGIEFSQLKESVAQQKRLREFLK